MPEVKDLIGRLKPVAQRAAECSHSPYSRFPVGAAVLDGGGRIFGGCNVENASFGLTLCAERNALAAAVASGMKPGAAQALVIYTPGPRAHAPCGACRQVMLELMTADAVVISTCDSDRVLSWRGAEHLPQPFTPEALADPSGEGT